MATTEERSAKIAQLRAFPPALRSAVNDLSDEQLDTPYRDGGWTPRQVVHHVVDSHVNGYLRFKWTLVEERPTIKTYDQDYWATMPDYNLPVESSLIVLDGLHHRWASLLTSLPDDAWRRTAMHPDRGEVTLDDLLDIYSEHGRNHAGQITDLRKRHGW
ncbi:MAG TPA: putative metal-dependent hydrolase [Gemmatimonadaceae bacterium]|nr:putative metal-dependent hydrolase [Gemmatimonadaceae bacterium]